MLSFSASNDDDLHLPETLSGSLWQHRFTSHSRAPHRHAELELNLVTGGRAAYLLGDRRYDLTAGTLVWLFPAQNHILLDESADHAAWIGVFKPRLVAEICTTSAEAVLKAADPFGHFTRKLRPGASERLQLLFLEVFGAQADTARYNAGLGYALLSAWSAYQSAEEPAVGPEVHPAVEHAARLLRDESDCLSVEQLAAQVGLSASRLSRLFHQQTGIALVDFRNRQRLHRFLHLYGRGRRVSILEAALDAGFGSYPQFHRVFKEQRGCSPAEYRRRIQGEEKC